MATVVRRGSGITVLRRVPYAIYEALRDEPANARLKMTYYDGTLEIMSPEFLHEGGSRKLGIVVLAVTSVLEIPCTGARSTTFRLPGDAPRKGKGKEPDECFYITHEGDLRGKQSLALPVDPPPDLWIEVDNRGSSKGRLPLYADLGVPEVWRYRARRDVLWFGRLNAAGAYEPIERSQALPMLTPALVLEALALGQDIPESTWFVRLQAWVRGQFGPGAPSAMPPGM